MWKLAIAAIIITTAILLFAGSGCEPWPQPEPLPPSELTIIESELEIIGIRYARVVGLAKNTGDQYLDGPKIEVILYDEVGNELDQGRDWYVNYDRERGEWHHLYPGETWSFLIGFHLEGASSYSIAWTTGLVHKNTEEKTEEKTEGYFGSWTPPKEELGSQARNWAIIFAICVVGLIWGLSSQQAGINPPAIVALPALLGLIASIIFLCRYAYLALWG